MHGHKKTEYKVIRPLGKGSFGCVWQIKKSKTNAEVPEKSRSKGSSNRHFALKEIYCNGERAYKQALFEVELMRNLNHPSTCSRDTGKKEGNNLRAPACEEYEVSFSAKCEGDVRFNLTQGYVVREKIKASFKGTGKNLETDETDNMFMSFDVSIKNKYKKK